MDKEDHRKNTLSFWISAALLLALGTFVVTTALQFLRDSRWLDHTTSVLEQVDRLTLLERSVMAAQRGYILTGDPKLQREFLRAKSELPHRITALKKAIQYKPAADLIAQAEPKLVERFRLASRGISVYEHRGMTAASEFMTSNGSVSLETEIGSLLARTRAMEMALVAERRAESERSALWLLVAAALGIPLTLTLLGLGQRLQLIEIARRKKSERLAQASAAKFEALSVNMKELSNYVSAIQSCASPYDLYTLTRLAFSALLPELSGAIFLTRDDGQLADVACRWGRYGGVGAAPPVPVDCLAIRDHRTHLSDATSTSAGCSHFRMLSGLPQASSACLPLYADGENMGWISLVSGQAEPVTGIDLAEHVTEQFALGLANMRLKGRLLHESIRDPLTGLFNRRYLEASLAREIARCVRRRLPLVVLMFDLDRFKDFNDRYGHGGGDALLSAFGTLLQSHCRTEDIACRFGGEEFILVMPEASMEVGLQRAKALLLATEQLVVSDGESPLGRVTSSIGLAVLPADGTNSGALLIAADKALYKAKAAGRNQVVIAAPIWPATAIDWPTVEREMIEIPEEVPLGEREW